MSKLNGGTLGLRTLCCFLNSLLGGGNECANIPHGGTQCFLRSRGLICAVCVNGFRAPSKRERDRAYLKKASLRTDKGHANSFVCMPFFSPGGEMSSKPISPLTTNHVRWSKLMSLGKWSLQSVFVEACQTWSIERST